MGQLLEQSTRCSLQSSLRILTVSECHPFSRWSMLRPPVVGFWRHTLYPQGSRRYNSVPCSHRSGRHLPPRTLATPESKIWVVSSWHNMPGSQPSKLMWPAKTSGMQRKEESSHRCQTLLPPPPAPLCALHLPPARGWTTADLLVTFWFLRSPMIA